MIPELIPECCRSCAGDDDSGVLLQEIIRSHAGEEKSRVLQEVLQEMTSPDVGGVRNLFLEFIGCPGLGTDKTQLQLVRSCTPLYTRCLDL